ncbi:MAG TPA: CoA-transferase [Candidatus Methylomirabilis sp.]|nr:CoA-transferase [Candidatus Methylomirabilis sp.]
MGSRDKPVLTAEQAAALVPSGATVTVSSSAAQLVPDTILGGIETRFLTTGAPRDLTVVFPVAVGDSFGTVGLDHLAHPGLVKRLIGGSYVNAPASKPSPQIYRMIHADQVEAYNLPLGVLMHLHRDIAAKKPGVLTQIGLGTFVDPRDQGGRMNRVTPPDLVEVVHLLGKEWLLYRAFPIDMAIIRGTTADAHGNLTLEHEGVILAVLAQAMAAHNSGGKVIAQVKRVAAPGTLDPQKVKVPGILVDALVVDPEQRQNTGIAYDPAISGEIRAARFPVEALPLGPEKVIARRALMQLVPGDIVNLGFGLSSLVPQIAFEEGVFGQLSFTVEQGAIGGLPLTGFAFGASHNPEAIIDSAAQFDLIDGGGVTAGCLAFAEVDGRGNVNVSRLEAQPHVLAGAGGFINIAQGTRRLFYCGTLTAGGLDVRVEEGRVRIVKDGRFHKFVERTQHVTFNGTLAARAGQEVWYFTERAVFRLTAEGLVLTELAPGIDMETDLRRRVGFPVRLAPELRPMDARLFRAEPMDLAADWRSVCAGA